MGAEWGKIIDFNWTLVINLLQFAVLLVLLRWLLWKPAVKYIERRRELIAARMAAAKTSEEKAGELVGQREAELAAAKKESVQILEEAHERAEKSLEDAKQRSREEADRILDDARAQLEHERDRVLADLKAQYAEIVVLGTEQVLSREVRIEDHRRLLDQLLVEIDDAALDGVKENR
ncbi:MAG: F0F1 ATP synthase subunit B [bacterium]